MSLSWASRAILNRATVAAISISVAAASADAQIATLHGPKTGEGVRDSSTATRRMTAALRTLMVAQDDWLKTHRGYGRALRRTGNGGLIVDLDAGITVELLYVTTKAWTGRATHSALSGRSCVVFVGDVPESRLPKTRHDGVIPTRERTPACDAP